MRSPGGLLPVCVLTLSVLAGCAATGSPVDMAAPQWSSGFAWTYAFEESWQESWQEDGEVGNESEQRQGRYVVEVLNTSISSGGEPLYLLGTETTVDGRSDPEVQVVRQRDLSRLPFRWSQNSQCVNGDCVRSFALDDVRTDMPTFLDFPLQTGKRWGGPVENDHGGPTIAYQATVEGGALVDTPLGTIAAARVVLHAAPADMSAFEREVRSEAASEGYQVDALRIDFRERQVAYYSDEYQTIVLHQRQSTESLYARGTDPEGKRFEFRAEETSAGRSVVEGARLVARPERTLTDVGMFLAGELPLRDPTGQAVADAGYTLAVDPPKAVVNAAAGEEATFTAAVSGELPNGTVLRWSLVSDDGTVVDGGTGAAMTVSVASPGRYGIEVESVRDDQVVSAAGAALVANWHRIDEMDCGPAHVGYPGCPERSLPVHVGAQSLYVRATPQGPLPDVGDTLAVIDSAGTRIEGERRGDDFVVELGSLTGHLVDDDPWTLRFEQGIAVLSPVEVEVQVLYGPATGTQVAPVGVQEARGGQYAPGLRLPW